MKSLYRGLGLMLFFSLLSLTILGQDSYQNAPLDVDRTRDAVQSARNGVDYSDEYQPQKKARESESSGSKGGGERERNRNDRRYSQPDSSSGTVSVFFQIALLLVVLGLIIFVLFRIFGNSPATMGKISDDAQNEEFAKLNLHDPLKEELGKGNYRLACRILYLQMLQELVKWRAILWRNEKTNWDYYKEAKSHAKIRKENLYTITNQYDYLWYGEQEPSLKEFNDFKNLINQLKRG